MNVAFHKTAGLARRALTIAFGLWLAGAGCAFCCTSADAATRAQAEDSSSVHGAHEPRIASAPTHCPSHARASKVANGDSDETAASARVLSPLGNHAGACCRKARQPSDPARKLNPETEPAANVARSEVARAEGYTFAGRPAARSRSPDGRTAHVRCCVFLI